MPTHRTISQILTSYGASIATYHGQGAFTCSDGTILHGRFRAAQLRSGSILVVLRVPRCEILPATTVLTDFMGTTHDGKPLSSHRPITFRHQYRSPHSTAILGMLDELVITHAPDASSRIIEFGLTNVLFRAHTPVRFQIPAIPERVILRPLPAYDTIADRLMVLHHVEVTYELRIPLSDQMDMTAAETLADDLCYVLSVATGTKIQWLYGREHAADQTITRLTHRAHITKSYTGWSNLPFYSASHLVTFLEQSYPVYIERKGPFALDQGVIDAYLDARNEDDYLETRGAKIVIAIEALKAVFLRTRDPKQSAYIIDPDTFAELHSRIKTTLRATLKESGQTNNDQRKKMLRKVGELNRRNFAHVLSDLFKHLSFQPEEKDIALFIHCRNSLVHQGAFYCMTATPTERASAPPKTTAIEEFRFLIAFLDRIFLHLLRCPTHAGSYSSDRSRR